MLAKICCFCPQEAFVANSSYATQNQAALRDVPLVETEFQKSEEFISNVLPNLLPMKTFRIIWGCVLTLESPVVTMCTT
jgi:hypothetical protein